MENRGETVLKKAAMLKSDLMEKWYVKANKSLIIRWFFLHVLRGRWCKNEILLKILGKCFWPTPKRCGLPLHWGMHIFRKRRCDIQMTISVTYKFYNGPNNSSMGCFKEEKKGRKGDNHTFQSQGVKGRYQNSHWTSKSLCHFSINMRVLQCLERYKLVLWTVLGKDSGSWTLNFRVEDGISTGTVFLCEKMSLPNFLFCTTI